MMLLPILFYGFWRVFTQDIHEESYGRSWFPLTAGFSLLVQPHLLTGEMVGAFTIVLYLVLWKKVFRRQTLLFTMYPKGQFRQEVCFRLICFLLFSNGTEVLFEVNVMENTVPVEIAPMAALLILAYLCFAGKLEKMVKRERAL